MFDNLMPDEIKIPEFLSSQTTFGAKASGCSTFCESYCETDCELSGEGSCTSANQGCTAGCQVSCQSTCQKSCQTNAECSESCGESSIPGAGTISVVKSMTTATSITVNISSISGATSYHIVWRKSSSSTVIGERTVSSAGNVTISGLDPNTSYTFNYYGINSAGSGPYASGVSETTLSGRPINWVWSTSFYSGKHLPVRADKTYVIVPASEWTRFQQRINEFRSYTGKPQFGFNSASSGDRFTAYAWNQAVWSICAMTGTNDSIFEASSVERITADMFQDLADELNSIP